MFEFSSCAKGGASTTAGVCGRREKSEGSCRNRGNGELNRVRDRKLGRRGCVLNWRASVP